MRFQIEMGVKRSGENRARDVETGVDMGSLSPDGEWIVFNRYQGSDYHAYVKKTNGVAAVRLGDGYGAGITWDASMVAAARNSQPHKLYLYPTGAGEQRVIDLGNLTAAFGTWENDLTFSRDGRWAVFSAFDPKQQIRDYLLDMRDGKLRPVTPVGTRAGKLSPDATRIVTLDVAAEKYVLVDIASGKVSEIPGIEKDDEVLGWNADGRMLCMEPGSAGAHIAGGRGQRAAAARSDGRAIGDAGLHVCTHGHLRGRQDRSLSAPARTVRDLHRGRAAVKFQF